MKILRGVSLDPPASVSSSHKTLHWDLRHTAGDPRQRLEMIVLGEVREGNTDGNITVILSGTEHHESVTTNIVISDRGRMEEEERKIVCGVVQRVYSLVTVP